MVSKKGVSDIVSTVLIVLLVVAAVAIIGSIILRTTNSASKTVESTLNCQELQILPTKCTYALGDESKPTVLIQRKAGGEKLNVTSVSVIFSEGVATETRNPTTFPGVLETKSYTVGTDLGVALANAPTSVAISAMVKDSSTACPLSKSVNCILAKKVNGALCTADNECESNYCNQNAIPDAVCQSSGNTLVAPTNIVLYPTSTPAGDVGATFTDNSAGETSYKLYAINSTGTAVLISTSTAVSGTGSMGSFSFGCEAITNKPGFASGNDYVKKICAVNGIQEVCATESNGGDSIDCTFSNPNNDWFGTFGGWEA